MTPSRRRRVSHCLGNATGVPQEPRRGRTAADPWGLCRTRQPPAGTAVPSTGPPWAIAGVEIATAGESSMAYSSPS
jgi:hypothetical protein